MNRTSSIADILVLLKSVSLFAGTPDDILLDIAGLVQVKHFNAGETIFHKGDHGDAMYIVSEGRLRAHDGELILNELGKRDVFGEMAALDAQPRSASVTALENGSMLRLGQDDMFRLMRARPEFALGIIQILSRRLRERVDELNADFVYMQQFAKVSSAAAAVESGIYEPESLNEVAQRRDELGNLARVFQRMIKEIYTREDRLRHQVEELRIEIDESKKLRQVNEITSNDYFKQLRSQAHQLRAERSRGVK